ncbi:Divergent polysaccharide deacetylase [Sulfitobacter sp. THAF37]|uniref:divergent polysaccharide deacetylase family protein n=1 Tax=Sulfitobacter sp. THAF37 TaxID=2587855 RepID=UPI001267E744|nr:divergent polysaccharide deacetylase family protein [Sulfitobacter sp. THAF37]QFT60216.1 Divergent polysaccharide deacetylase [Sulfitobacter sp. THAF37]
MARGFLKGAVLGGVVSVSVAGLASVLLDPPLPPEVGDAAPGGTRAPARADDTGAAEGSLSDTAPASVPAAPQASPPDPDTLATLDDGTTSPAAAPETGGVEGLNTPEDGPETGAVAAEGESPVLPNPQALAPMAPQDPDELSISTEPAQPPLPEAEAGPFEAAPDVPDAPVQPDAPEVGDAAPEAPETPAESDESTVETSVPDAEGDPAPQVDPSEPPQTADAADLSPPDAPEVSTSDADALPDSSQTAPAETPQTESAETESPETESAETESPETENSETESPETPQAADAASGRPAIGTPAVTLTERDSGVTINRPGATDPATEAAGPETPPVEEAETETLPPIQANAEAVPETGGKPLMGIILIDDGSGVTSGAQGLAALRSFPYPLSFAVDASRPDAAERMALYREAGFEVLAMIGLPEGAQPSDAETTFNVVLPQLDQVVAVLEAPGGGFQSERDLSDHITAILADSGHGLVTQDKGLNTMPKLARKEGVPAEPVFRDFDSKGQSATVIRRFLDQAAFKAGQEGAVIMLGRLRPDTISALLLWGLQDRAGSVALVPVSAVLSRE